MKRAIDIIAAVSVLLILAPLILLLIVAVRLALGSPVFFRQDRPGRNGYLFKMIKFRTMRHSVDHSGALLPDSERLTPFGRWLRSTSLDELPELWNVLRGDMSIVGPRPLLVEYLPLYSQMQARRHEVRPGLTGLAQVSGRNALTWDEKFDLDIWYVDHQTLWLDAIIILKTIYFVIKREGISATGDATMPKFVGAGRKASEAVSK